jgi:uncharacterized protein (DUF1015 family)
MEIPKAKETLGIPRDKMPQIASNHYEDFLNYLKKNDVVMKKRKVAAKLLRPIQKEFSKDGVENSMTKTLTNEKTPKPLIASSDMYIIDGHHRWLAIKNLDSNAKIEIYQANIPMKELLPLTLNYSKITFKGIY